jgi:hypothetical protein
MLPVLANPGGNHWFPCRDVAQFALRAAGSYIAYVLRPNPMKHGTIIALAVAVALAFAGGSGSRHAPAATQNHDHAAVVGTKQDEHSHHDAGSKHSHDHDVAASRDTHDPIEPASDQGCCYAWCSSVAVIHAADGLLIGTSSEKPLASERPFRIAAFPSAIDPPPR